jgi:hypothetical protein
MYSKFILQRYIAPPFLGGDGGFLLWVACGFHTNMV